MPGIRTSTRLADKSSSQNENSSPSAKAPSKNGVKRKADSSPSSTTNKKGRKTEDKEQKTIEQTLGVGHQEEAKDQSEDIEMKEGEDAGAGTNAKSEDREELRAMRTSCQFDFVGSYFN